MGPHLTQCRLGRGLLPYQMASSYIQPFGRHRYGPKIGGGLCPPFWGVDGSPSNTVSPRPRLTSLPSVISIHPAVWPQQTWAENWGLCCFGGGELDVHLTQCGQCRGLHSKFHIDPSNRLATVHQGYRHNKQDRTYTAHCQHSLKISCRSVQKFFAQSC